MAKIIISNAKRFSAVFSERTLALYNPVSGYTVEYFKRLFVNWSLPLLTWNSHDVKCVEDILDMLRLVGQWQGKLQDAKPRFNAHAHPPTILRDNGLKDQKVRFPVFAKQSAPYVQWVRDEEQGSRWLVHGYAFNNDLPSLGAYFSALSKLKDEFLKINR
jgi:hypothetical protein